MSNFSIRIEIFKEGEERIGPQLLAFYRNLRMMPHGESRYRILSGLMKIIKKLVLN
jgi:hypothetical protein